MKAMKALYTAVCLVIIMALVAACTPAATAPTAAPTKPAATTAATVAPTKPAATIAPTIAPTKVPAAPKVLKIGIGAEELSFDPATGTTATPQYPIKTVYRGLYSFDKDGKLKPEIATSYKVSDDGLVYTFTLRKDAKWSDGKLVTAKDFVYGWQRNLVPELKAAYASMFTAVVNYADCIGGKKPLAEFGVKAVDDTTLQVNLTTTQPYFPLMTTFSPFYPVREDKVPKNSDKWSKENVKDIVTNGPYKYDSYVANSKIVLAPNPESYEKANVKIDKIEFYFIPDMQAQVAAFKTGEIDMALLLPADVSTTYPNKAEIKTVPYLANNIYIFSAKNPVFADIKVREALTIAINRAQVAKIMGGINQPLYSLIPPGVTNPATGKDFRAEGGNLVKEDVARAKKLLADAGFADGKGFPKVTWLYNNTQIHSDVAQAVQAMLKENLGIEITLRGIDSASFSADRRAGNFDIARLGTSADYVDPTTWLNLYISNTEYIQRVSGYKTPEFDKIMAESDKILDPAKRFEALHQAEKELVSQFWWIPISSSQKEMLQKDYVKDVFTSTAGDVFVMFADIVK